jgi:hypothetical protein
MEMAGNEMQLNRKVEKWAAPKNAMSSSRVNDANNSGTRQQSPAVPSLRDLLWCFQIIEIQEWKTLLHKKKTPALSDGGDVGTFPGRRNSRGGCASAR